MRTRIALTLLALLAATVAVPAPAQAATTRTLADGRTYDLHRLNAGTDARPLVVVIHGRTGSSSSLVSVAGWSQYADTHGGFAVAYAQALIASPGTNGTAPATAWNSGGCCSGQTANDVAYIRALVEDARRTVRVSNVYVVGFSNGGMMTARVGCALPNLARGIGIVGGVLDPGGAFGCATGTVPLRVRHLHGAQDDRVPVNEPTRSYDFRPGPFPSSLTERDRFAPTVDYSARLDLPCGHIWPEPDNACGYDATADLAAFFGI